METEEQKDTGSILADQRGNLSSKRVSGMVMIIAGVVDLVTLGAYSIFATVTIPNADVAWNVGMTLTGVGAGLLGISIVEWFAPKGKG